MGLSKMSMASGSPASPLDTLWGISCLGVSAKIGVERMIMLATLGLATGVLITALALAGVFNPAAVFLPAVLMSVGNGLVLPSPSRQLSASIRSAAGAASGLTGFLQAGIGGAASYPRRSDRRRDGLAHGDDHAGLLALAILAARLAPKG